MRRQFHLVFGWMPALTAFVMPLHPRFTALTLAIWAIVAVSDELLGKLEHGRSAQARIGSMSAAGKWFARGGALMYALYGLGMLWSENTEAGWFALEVKFSMVLLPALMLHWAERKGAPGLHRTIPAFLLGLTILACWRAGSAFQAGTFEAWRYDELAGPFHPTYLGMYLALSMLVNPLSGRWHKGLALVSGLFVGLLASKAAWMVAGGIWGLQWLRAVRKRQPRKLWWGGAIGMLLVGAVVGDGGRWSEFQSYVYPSTQLEPPVTKTSEGTAEALSPLPSKVGSSAGRVQAWKAAAEVMTSTPWGVGTGDVTDELCRKYREHNAEYALEKRMNPHSVWLQIGVSHGWLGLVMMVLWWGGTVRLAWKHRQWILLLWCTIWILNGTIESLLELQQGVVPTMFLTLLLSTRSEQP